MLWWIAFIAIVGILSYQKASLSIWGISLGLFLVVLARTSQLSWVTSSFLGGLFAVSFILFGCSWVRQRFIIKPIFKLYRKLMPTMSTTEREALSAGTVGWEGDLFSGSPDWEKLYSFQKPQLTNEEVAFLEGPVEQLCRMIDDWDITHNRADMPAAMWEFLKKNGFFALIIPKKYQGKEFSAYAHSQILMKIYSRSTTVGSTVAVPNSLGPAELLLHYGTEEQKNYYLPRLARGEEVPCFALTGPDAGSDAGAMPDKGIICWGEHEGNQILGIRLNWNKRYITLAPVATVIGLAFKLYDPEHLLGQEEELGITCALVPRHMPGITIGRRHYPANIVFQNGPIQGQDVFIPVDWIIGGAKMAGQGWRMLMECLAAGRAISLPASSIGGAKALVYASGAYAHIRKQFNIPIGYFEGIEEVLARMAGNTYVMDAVRTFTVGRIDQGEQPAVASAISKYHVTELGRIVANDAMDLHGGKAICMGPRNYLSTFYQSIPIAITVEGANILTRNMIIFGQGVMRCHPYVFAEYEAAKMEDEKIALSTFDNALTKHMSFVLSNLTRSVVLGLTQKSGRAVKSYLRSLTRFSAAFAFMTDVSLLTYGGKLKRKESMSARLGDILSYLYLLSSVLKHFHDQDEPDDDLAIIQWACQTYLYKIQQRFYELFNNLPNRWVAALLRLLIFPFGKTFSEPRDSLNHQVAQLLLNPTDTRNRLTAGAFLTSVENNVLAWTQEALIKVIAAEPIEKLLKEAVHNGLIESGTVLEQANTAYDKKLITQQQLQVILDAESAREKVIAVDDFSSAELARNHE